MLRSARFEVYAPATAHRADQGDERVKTGWSLRWAGYGTFKELDTRTSTRELGRAGELTATARSRAIPADLNIVIGSWQVRGPNGRWYEINNRTRTGDLTTLSLTEAQDQHGSNR